MNLKYDFEIRTGTELPSKEFEIGLWPRLSTNLQTNKGKSDKNRTRVEG